MFLEATYGLSLVFAFTLRLSNPVELGPVSRGDFCRDPSSQSRQTIGSLASQLREP